MNGNTELLNFVYQNAEMGVSTLEQILSTIDDMELKMQLRMQLKEYEGMLSEAKNMLRDSGHDEKGISSFEKIKAYLMINLQTLTDKSTSHIAEMIIIGSNMGVIDAIRKMKEYSDADKDILKLMKKLLKFEEENIIKLRNFL